jgi:hypothetical protein
MGRDPQQLAALSELEARADDARLEATMRLFELRLGFWPTGRGRAGGSSCDETHRARLSHLWARLDMEPSAY